MKLGAALCCGAMLTAGCGGGGGDAAAGPSPLAFAGTVDITSALPAGATTCAATTVVTFDATGADKHTLSLQGGDCLEFVNQDTTVRRPGAAGGTPCAELTGPALSKGQSFTTAPLGGPKTCQWQDALHPVPTGGGSGY